MPRVLEENTHPVFPSSPIMGHVDQVGSWEPCRQGPMLFPYVDTDQHPNHQRLSPEGLLKLPVKCIIVEGHWAVGIDNHQVIVLGIGYQCGGHQQGLGESQTGFYGAQMSGGEVGHTVSVVRHQVPGQQHAATHELIDRQSLGYMPLHFSKVWLVIKALRQVRRPGLADSPNPGPYVHSWRDSFARHPQRLQSSPGQWWPW